MATGKESKVSNSINGGNSVLCAVDNTRTNVKLTQKNNNGTNNNHYQTNLINQKQLNNSLHELHNNKNDKNSGKDARQYTSLTTIFDQFTDVITLDDSGEESDNQNSSSSSSSSSTSGSIGYNKNQAVLLNLANDFTSKDQKSKWEAILYNNNLYLQIPAGVLFETSKEAFVNLLEYAEEELKCQNVVICLDKNSVEKLNNLIRMFMYFGFSALSPSHPLTPKNASDNLLFMAYNFE